MAQPRDDFDRFLDTPLPGSADSPITPPPSLERELSKPPAPPPPDVPRGTLEGEDDAAGDYLRDLQERRLQQDSASFEEWLDSFEPPASAKQAPQEQPIKLRPAEHKRPSSEEESTAGMISRNVVEIPGQAVMGVHDAVMNAAQLFNPLTDWLNENVADLRYESPFQPRTLTGRISRSSSTFLTGFIPALKYMRGLGAGAITGPMAAGAISDFLTKDPHEARLADLWNQMGFPKNFLSDSLASDPTDTQMEARVKNALEGVAVGLATEGGKRMLQGVMHAWRLMRAAKAVQRGEAVSIAAHTAEEAARQQYGEITDEMATRIWGDSTKPALTVLEGTADDLAKPQAKQITVQSPVGAINLADQRIIEATKATSGVEPRGLQQAIREGVEGGKREPRIGQAAEVGGRQEPQMPAGEVPVGGRVEPTLTQAASQTAEPLLTAEQARGFVGKVPAQVFVNWARINEPNDIKALMQDMTERYAGRIKEAQRGVITHEQTEAMAEEFGLDAKWLLQRKKGEPLNAERMLAARQLWAASAENLETHIRRAADLNAGLADQAAFQRALAMHHAIQNEAIGARTEVARSLSAMRIPAGGGIEKAQALQELMDQSGGFAHSADLARRMQIVLDHAPDAATKRRTISKMAEIAQKATVWDAFSEVWVNGLLSSPATHIVNTGSSLMAAYQQVYERGAASLIAQARGAQGSVAPGEALAMLHAQVSATKDAFRMGWRALRTGETGAALGKVDLPRKNALAAETFRLRNDSTLGRVVNVIGSGFRLPSRLMAAEDEFVKTIASRGELAAQALRQATQEGHKGAAHALRVEQLMQNPTEAMRLAVKDATLYSTFTQDPGEVGKWLLRGRSRIPATVLVAPFIKTPVNIARYTFERSPFAPLVGQWKADIAAGGARADIALARMATGTSMMLVALDLADRGLISGKGPKDPAERAALQRQGWKPYSVKVGNRWHPINRLDPLGAQLGFAANVAEMVRTRELNEDDLDEATEIMGMGTAAVSEVAINKTYLQGFSDFINLMNDAERYGENHVEKLVGSMVPLMALSGAVKRVVDPTKREVYGGWDAIENKLAGFSDKLPPVLNLWGEEIKDTVEFGGPAAGPGMKVATKTFDFFSPIASSSIKPSPIDAEIVRLAPIGAADNTVGSAPNRIPKKAIFKANPNVSVQVNFKEWPEVYTQYVKLAGNDLKHPFLGLGAKDALNDMVTGKGPLAPFYKLRQDPYKLQMINNIISQYRELAQYAILRDPKFKDFAAHVQTIAARKQQQRMPIFDEPTSFNNIPSSPAEVPAAVAQMVGTDEFANL